MRTPEEIEETLSKYKVELPNAIAQKLNVDEEWSFALVEMLLNAASLKVSADYLWAAREAAKEMGK